MGGKARDARSEHLHEVEVERFLVAPGRTLTLQAGNIPDVIIRGNTAYLSIGNGLKAVAEGALGNEDHVHAPNVTFPVGNLTRETVLRRRHFQLASQVLVEAGVNEGGKALKGGIHVSAGQRGKLIAAVEV